MQEEFLDWDILWLLAFKSPRDACTTLSCLVNRRELWRKCVQNFHLPGRGYPNYQSWHEPHWQKQHSGQSPVLFSWTPSWQISLSSGEQIQTPGPNWWKSYGCLKPRKRKAESDWSNNGSYIYIEVSLFVLFSFFLHLSVSLIHPHTCPLLQPSLPFPRVFFTNCPSMPIESSQFSVILCRAFSRRSRVSLWQGGIR